MNLEKEVDVDSEEEKSSVNQKTKSKKISKTRQCINFFGACRQKNETEKRKNYKYNMGQFDFVKILSTSNSRFKGKSKFL